MRPIRKEPWRLAQRAKRRRAVPTFKGRLILGKSAREMRIERNKNDQVRVRMPT